MSEPEWKIIIDIGYKYLADALIKNSTITSIHFDDNNISDYQHSIIVNLLAEKIKAREEKARLLKISKRVKFAGKIQYIVYKLNIL